VAFCGNRFEFRAVGASVNTAWSTTVLNTITAESMEFIAGEVEKLKDQGERSPLNVVLMKILREHQKIIFNGNNYSEDWIKEAESRGLPNNRDAASALKVLAAEKNKKLFSSTGVLSPVELAIRSDVFYNNYYLDLTVELRTMLDMCLQFVLPAGQQQLAALENVQFVEMAATLREKMNELIGGIHRCRELDTRMINMESDVLRAEFIRDHVRPAIEKVRASADWIEGVVAARFWSLPTYSEMIHVGH